MTKVAKNHKIRDFSEIDKDLYPLIAPSKKYPESLAVLQNAFWLLQHEKPPKDDLLKLMMYFSPKVRLTECELSDKTIFFITAKEYAALTGLSLKGAYTALSRVVDALYEHSVIYECKQRGPVRTRLATSVAYKDGCFSVSFTHYALYTMYVFSKETPFTKLQIKSLSALYGHSLRLYPFLVRNAFRHDFEIALPDLKVALDLSSDSYPEYRDFKTTILKPHIDLINQSTELTVQFRAVKKEGRKASHVGFTISTKKEVTPSQPKSQSNTPSQPDRERAISFVMDTLRKRNLFDRFKMANETNMQVMLRIRKEMEGEDYLHWEQKLKEYTLSIPLELENFFSTS